MIEFYIFDLKKLHNVGPIFSVGLNEKFKTREEAMTAATDWIKQASNAADLQIRSSYVGFL